LIEQNGCTADVHPRWALCVGVCGCMCGSAVFGDGFIFLFYFYFFVVVKTAFLFFVVVKTAFILRGQKL
jgi:hypothetical protein